MSATMDLFDLTLVSAAVIFHLSIVGVYIAQKKIGLRFDTERFFVF